MIMACDINSPVFISGFAGQGWKLDNNSGTSFDLEVDNLRVRNVLTAYELEILSSANGIPYSVVGTRFYFDTDGGNSAIQFVVNDYIRAQIWTGSGIGSYLGIVTNVHQSATLGDAYIDATTISGSPWDKMKAVQVGNSSNVSRQNIIYLTASDSCNPYIDMLSGVNAGTFAGHNRVRIGNLCGISDAAFGGALSGYGLYADNIYLKGAIVISAGCGYTNLCDKPLSLSAINITEANKLAGIAAGATNISNTNQLVDGANLGGTATWNSIAAVPSYLGGPGSAGLYMGSCYMGYYNGSAWQTYIDCNGNVQFQGVSSFGTTSCSGDNIHLMGASISDDSYCGDCGTIYINYTGYHGSCDYTRNLIVGNGKGANGLMAYFDGTNKRIGFVNNIAPDSTFMVGTHNGAGLKINCGESGNNFIYGTLTSNSTITATNFILSSDERLKTNIQSLSIAPVNVDYKQFNLCNDIEQPRYGVIAQELQLHNPELVRTDENGMLSVSYFDLFAKEISALKCQVKELQHDLNYYRNYNDIK